MVIHWFRRDLRLNDNAGLYHALKSGSKVQCVFIFDKAILEKLPDKADRRVDFIHQSLESLNNELGRYGSTLRVYFDYPARAWEEILLEFNPGAVFTNHDYEPYARERDAEVKEKLEKKGVTFHTFKDQCIFEKDEVIKEDGKPYTVFTPYSRKWRSKLRDFYLRSYPTEKYFTNLNQLAPRPLPPIGNLGFRKTDLPFPSKETTTGIIRKYAEQRDFPAIEGTSRLGIHLRFGTISIRERARKALKLSDTWINELIWRDFYMQILWHFPHVATGPFRKPYEKIPWRNNETEFNAWCEGKTGYPIVDAGMRELNASGYMHNRVRMITASFLTKHLLVDWRWGEAYFATKLLDYDLSANNGGWQWAAGCGTDAAPYFRIFNPSSQTLKFDKDHLYIRKWVPEFDTPAYPEPIVEHAFARARCLSVYKTALL